MGVLVDYFAASREEFVALDLASGLAAAGWPYVDCKGWLDGAGWLAAELTDQDPSVVGGDELVLDGGEEGPWVTRVPPEVTAALAGVDQTRLQEYADDELLDEDELTRFTDLLGLARSAVVNGRDVYCWSSL